MSLSARKDSLKSPQNEAFVRARARGKSERARDRKGTRLEAAGAKGGPESGTRAAKERAALCVSSYHAALYGPLIFAALSRARSFASAAPALYRHFILLRLIAAVKHYTPPDLSPSLPRASQRGREWEPPSHCVRRCTAVYWWERSVYARVWGLARARQTICTVALSLSLGSSVWESRANCMYMRAV